MYKLRGWIVRYRTRFVLCISSFQKICTWNQITQPSELSGLRLIFVEYGVCRINQLPGLHLVSARNIFTNSRFNSGSLHVLWVNKPVCLFTQPRADQAVFAHSMMAPAPSWEEGV